MIRNVLMEILAIQNCKTEGFGLYEKYFVDHKIEYRVVHAYRHHSLPRADAFDAILVGGTPISAYEAREHPFLQKEREYLHDALLAEKPCFGICCGAQILAQLLGAQVRKCQRKEIGSYEVRLTAVGQRDPLFDGFPTRFPVFHWHGDTFDIPAGAELLIEGDGCTNQLFRDHNVVGVQFHLEVTAEEAAAWADEYAEELAEFGKSKQQVVGECDRREQEMRPLAARLLHNFLNFVALQSAGTL